MHQMKLFQPAVAIFLVVVFFGAGCTQNSTPKRKPVFGHSLMPQTDNRYYYFTEAQIQRRMGNLDKAIVLLKKAIEMDPDSLYLKRELATVYLQNKEDDNAIGVLEDILKEHPDDVRSLILYGGIQQVRKNSQEAIDAYERVLAQDPQQQKVYSLLGGMYPNRRIK